MEKYSLKVLRKILSDAVILGAVLSVMLWLDGRQPFQRGFFCGDQSIMYPFSPNTVSSNTLHIVGIVVPAFAIIAVEIATLYRVKEATCRVFGLPLPAWLRSSYSVVLTFVLGVLGTELATNLSKITIGRLRPCFLDVCNPSIDCSLPANQNRYILPEEFHCTKTELYPGQMRDIRMSFMSGHSSWSAYTMVFLALYLHRRLSWSATRLPGLAVQFAVVMVSFFTALTRVSDYRHHWSDVMMGFGTGTLFAIIIATWCVSWLDKDKLESKQETAPCLEKVTVNTNSNNVAST